MATQRRRILGSQKVSYLELGRKAGVNVDKGVRAVGISVPPPILFPKQDF